MLQQSISIARCMTIRLTFKIEAAGGQQAGGIMVVMFHGFFVSCVFFGAWVVVDWWESAIGLSDSKKASYVGFSIKCRLQNFSFNFTPTYVGLSHEKWLHFYHWFQTINSIQLDKNCQSNSIFLCYVQRTSVGEKKKKEEVFRNFVKLFDIRIRLVNLKGDILHFLAGRPWRLKFGFENSSLSSFSCC